MSRVDIPNLGVKVWTRKPDLRPVKYLCYLTQPATTRKILFELTDIEYDQIMIKLQVWYL